MPTEIIVYYSNYCIIQTGTYEVDMAMQANYIYTLASASTSPLTKQLQTQCDIPSLYSLQLSIEGHPIIPE